MVGGAFAYANESLGMRPRVWGLGSLVVSDVQLQEIGQTDGFRYHKVSTESTEGKVYGAQ
jgi:hypothetical protein